MKKKMSSPQWTCSTSGSGGDIDIRMGLWTWLERKGKGVIRWVTWKLTLQYVKCSVGILLCRLKPKLGLSNHQEGMGWGRDGRRCSDGGYAKDKPMNDLCWCLLETNF